MRKSVGLAILIVTLTILPAAAQPAPAGAGSTDFNALVNRYWTAWGSGDPEKADALYAKDPDLVFYDLEPVKYVGWAAYKAGVVPNILSKFATVKFTLNDDVKATRRGTLAWTTVTVRGEGTLKAGGPVNVVMRHTAIWERRGPDWVIVHDHVSVPSNLPAAPGTE